MADPSEPVWAGCLQRFQDRLNFIAQVQVGVTDYGCRCPARAVETARAGGGQTLDEFDLTDGAHLLRSVTTVHGPCLDVHGGTDVVTGVDVIGQLVKKIPMIGNPRGPEVPEVVIRIADGYLRLQLRFLGLSKPVIASEWHNDASLASTKWCWAAAQSY